MDPKIIQRVPLPSLSTIRPNSGAKMTVENGSMDTIQPAASAGMSKRGIRMAPANFLNAMMLL